MNKIVLSRSELRKILNISRTHLCRLLDKHNVKPIENTIHTQKKFYRVADIEQVFNVKINDENDESYKSKTMLDEIDDILEEK